MNVYRHEVHSVTQLSVLSLLDRLGCGFCFVFYECCWSFLCDIHFLQRPRKRAGEEKVISMLCLLCTASCHILVMLRSKRVSLHDMLLPHTVTIVSWLWRNAIKRPKLTMCKFVSQNSIMTLLLLLYNSSLFHLDMYLISIYLQIRHRYNLSCN